MAIKAKITVDNKELKQGFKNAEKQAKNSMNIIKDVAGSASKGFGNLSSVLTKISGKFAIVIGVAFAAYKAVKTWFNYVDRTLHKMNDIGKAAKAINMTAEAYQEVNFAARRSGVAVEQVQNIISKLTYAFTKAAEGTRETVDAFGALGLSWSELEKMSPEVQLFSILRGLKQINDVTKRTKILSDLGFSKRDIQNFNKMINNDFAKIMASSNIYGVAFTEEQIELAEKYIDEIETATEQMDVFISKIKKFEETKELLEKFKSDISQGLVELLNGSNAKISDKYKDYYIGIGDAAEEFLERLKRNDKALYDHVMFMRKAWEIYGNGIFDGAAYFDRNYLFPVVAQQDSRFSNYSPDDKSTWVKEREDANGIQFDQEKIKLDKIDAAIKRINQELDAKKKKHKDHIASLEKEFTLASLIKKIEEEAGFKLDPSFINQIREIYNEIKKFEHIDIKVTIDAQTEKLRLMHEIEMAILNNDKERARVLRTILKLQEAGIDATEEEVNNSETNVEDAQKQVDKWTKSKELFTPDHEYFQKHSQDYMKYKAEAEKKLQELIKLGEEWKKVDEDDWTRGFYEKQREKSRIEAEMNRLKREASIALDEAANAQRGMKRNETGEADYQEAQEHLKNAETTLGRAQAIQAATAQVSEEDRQEAERKQKTLEQHTKELERQNEITQAEINGDLERANTLRLLNDLKQMGIDIDEEELQKNREKYDALIKQRELQRELNLNKSFQDQEKSLLAQAMRRVGLTKQAAYYEAVLNAERMKGAKLTEAETERVKKLVDIQFKINDPSLKLDLSGMGIKTNELTARGGFATGAVFTDKDKINSEIRNYAKRQADLLNEIKEEIKNGGLI